MEGVTFNYDERRVTPVREIMATTVVVVSPDDSLIKATKVMRDHRVSGLPVVDATSKVVGVISERDVIKELHRAAGLMTYRGILDLLLAFDGSEGADRIQTSVQRLHSAHVRDVMSTKVVQVEPDSTLQESLRLMRQFGINRLPVVERGRLVGIVTRGDVLAALAPPPGTQVV